MKNQSNKAFKVYQASAGSGKTYTIVKEYLSLCLESKASTSKYDQILAITFTNLAANEMKAKITDQLYDIINSDPNKEAEDMEADLIRELHISRSQLKENAKDLFTKIIHNYSDFCICTIDAFVQRLARSFAKELNLPSLFSVSIDEDEVADAITERIGEKIGTDKGQVETDKEYLTKVVEDYSARKFDSEKSSKIAGNIREFVKVLFSENAFQKDEHNLLATKEKYKETHDFIKGKMQSFENQCQQFAKQFEEFLHRNHLTSDDFNGKSRNACLNFHKKIQKKEYVSISDSLNKILKGDTDWYSKNLKRHENLDAEFNTVFIDPVKKYQENIGKYLFYKSQLAKLSLYALRSRIMSELEAYIGEEQIVHISEFNKRINKVMDDFSVPFIYERLGEHFKHLFIDEFQDTSVLQWQNLLPLLDNSLANNNMSMVVGDGKQSIYRWRNGEVRQITSLPEIYGRPMGNPAMQSFERSMINNFNFNELKTNHRSLQNIIDFNNDFFRFCIEENYLSGDCRKVYVEENKQYDKKVTVKQYHYYEEKGYVQVELFNPAECDDEMMLGRVKELIEEAIDKGFTKSDITILVRKNKTGSLIAEYLNENGIDVVSAESILLKTSDRVLLIVNTLDYMIHSDNPAIVATVLYYWNATHRKDYEGTANGVFDQARRIAEGEVSMEETLGLEPHALKQLLSRSYSLYDLCSAIIRLFGFNTVGDTFLNFLLETVYKWQSANEASIKGFLEYWESKKDKLAVASGNTDAVNVMTIHKSKGLQFNVVICPFVIDDLDDKKPSTLWIAPQDLGFDPIPNIEKVQFTLTKDSATWSKEAATLADNENAKVRLDNLNLNYVAFTRAVQRLHILSYEAKDLTKSPLNKFLQNNPDQYGDPETRKVELKKKNKKKNPVTEFLHESAASEWFNKLKIDSNPSMFWLHPDDKMSPVEWGTFVHKTLSEVQHESDFDRVLQPHIDAGVIDKTTAEMLRSQFQQMASHPIIGKAFSTQAKVKNECEILSTKSKKILRPDRYAELPQKIYLLDYKTGKPDKEHHNQLYLYKNVLKKMVKKPIEAYLVYLGDTIKVVPVSVESQQLAIDF